MILLLSLHCFSFLIPAGDLLFMLAFFDVNPKGRGDWRWMLLKGSCSILIDLLCIFGMLLP